MFAIACQDGCKFRRKRQVAFAVLLAVYLVGNAGGAALWSRFRAAPERSRAIVIATMLACLAGTLALAEEIRSRLERQSALKEI